LGQEPKGKSEKTQNRTDEKQEKKKSTGDTWKKRGERFGRKWGMGVETFIGVVFRQEPVWWGRLAKKKRSVRRSKGIKKAIWWGRKVYQHKRKNSKKRRTDPGLGGGQSGVKKGGVHTADEATGKERANGSREKGKERGAGKGDGLHNYHKVSTWDGSQMTSGRGGVKREKKKQRVTKGKVKTKSGRKRPKPGKFNDCEIIHRFRQKRVEGKSGRMVLHVRGKGHGRQGERGGGETTDVDRFEAKSLEKKLDIGKR